MRTLLAIALLVAAIGAARATQPSWPIVPAVEFAPAAAGASISRATVRIVVGDDASAIDIDVYGTDGLRVGDSNLVHVHRDRLARGESFVFDVPIRAPAGRAYVMVAAKARFAHAGAGGTVLGFPLGSENAAQRRAHSACVRQDPDGLWIRIPGCEETAQAAAPPPVAPVRVLTVEALRAAPPVGEEVEVEGFIVEQYRCPPCPRGATCKPCMRPSAIFIAASIRSAPIDIAAPPADVLVIATQRAGDFRQGARYRFVMLVEDRATTRRDGRLLRFRSDTETTWTQE